MKLLITGGTGFLGRHIVWRAAAEGADVIFTGRNPEAAAEVIRHAKKSVHWQPLIHGDSGAEATLTKLSSNADAIVHCAALSSPWGRASVFHQANVISTKEVIQACQANAIPRLVHVSTPSIYFGFSDQLNIKEDAALPPPANHYARTKNEAETLVRQAGMPAVVILRPRALFGPWDQTLVPRLLRVMQRGPIPVMRSTPITLDLTYIDNAVEAVWRSITRPLPARINTYNVSNGEPRELLELLEFMAGAFDIPLRTRRLPWPVVSTLARFMELAAHARGGNEPMLTRYSAGVLAFSQTLDVSALRRDLGWQPRVSINEGIEQHARWWRSQNS